MGEEKAFQRENQRISASEILQAMVSGEEIRLEKCTVSGSLNVNRLLVKDEDFETSGLSLSSEKGKSILTFSQSIVFNSCTFEGDVFFAPPWDKPGELEVVFKRDVNFNSSVFLSPSRFSGGCFHGLAAFDGCTFHRVACFRDATFRGRAMFRTVTFKGYGLFNSTEFCKEARFTNTSFGKGCNFTETRFDGRADFTGVHSQSKAVPIYESVHFARHRYGDDETFWRFIKQASQEAGYYHLAGESFYNERCAHLWRKLRGSNYEHLSIFRKMGRFLLGIRLLPELLFGRLLFGYGERPVRVLAASAIIIIFCGLFYSSPYAMVSLRSEIGQNQLQFMDGLYFSTITFTTLGFGDMYPASTDLLTKCVAMFEALSGACLMALFVVSLSKRYSRG
jgi:hypothetical protein